MKSEMITEIVEFEVNVSMDEFVEKTSILHNFYENLEGYLDMEVCNVEENRWILILHWSSDEAEKNASSKMMTSDETNDFKSTVIPTSFSKRKISRVKKYSL